MLFSRGSECFCLWFLDSNFDFLREEESVEGYGEHEIAQIGGGKGSKRWISNFSLTFFL
jgi:hypothetical protein